MFAFNVKSFAIVIIVFFLNFFLLVDISGRSTKSVLSNFRQLLLQRCVTETGSPSFDTNANYWVCVLKLRLWEHGMSCTLDINSNGGWW